MKTLVLINRQAAGGMASDKWRTIAPRIDGIFGGSPLVYDQTFDWNQLVRDAVNGGPFRVVAAGGDGTVHKVANLLLSLPVKMRSNTLFGAVGLGTSNDFHKPWNGCLRVQGIPVRWASDGTTSQNVLCIEYLDEQSVKHVEYALTSCSLGAVALGNHLFNRRWGHVDLCRHMSPAAGIWSASLAGLFFQRGLRLTLCIDGTRRYEGEACLIGIYVNRHFAGRLSYTSSVDVLSPMMGVTLLPNVGLLQRLSLLARAARVGLPGPPHTRTWKGTACRITCERPNLLEMDGEVFLAKEIRIRLLPGALKVCR